MKYFSTFGGVVVGLCIIVIVVLGIVATLVLWMYERKKRKKDDKKKEDEKKETKKPEKSPFENWKYHSWRSMLFIAPALGILYLVAKWSQFKGTFLQFITTQKVLGLVFLISVATYIITYSVLSTPDWKWYARLSRKVSGWAIIILLTCLMFKHAGCSFQKLGLVDPNLASLPPVTVCSEGTVSIIYKPEYIKQEVNLDLLPGKKYKVYIDSYMEWEDINQHRGEVFSYGLPRTLRALRLEHGKEAKLEEYPLKDEDSNFAGVVANIDGHNKWIISRDVLEGKHLKFITLNVRPKRSSFLRFKGLMRITLVPQKE